jgi:hypothetical protein
MQKENKVNADLRQARYDTSDCRTRSIRGTTREAVVATIASRTPAVYGRHWAVRSCFLDTGACSRASDRRCSSDDSHQVDQSHHTIQTMSSARQNRLKHSSPQHDGLTRIRSNSFGATDRQVIDALRPGVAI